MWFGVVTLFPEMFAAVERYGITRRACEAGLISVAHWNPRDFTTDPHRTVDDASYGGGPGMVLKARPVLAALAAARTEGPLAAEVVYLTPQGRRADQSLLAELAGLPGVIFLAGRYEGVDERVIDAAVDREVSIGDYVLSGGELGAMVLIDGISRLLPGVVGDRESVANDSFASALLDYPHYTRPELVDGVGVPPVLLSGDHAAIARWREKQALGRTFVRRPELLETLEIDARQRTLIDEYLNEIDHEIDDEIDNAGEQGITDRIGRDDK